MGRKSNVNVWESNVKKGKIQNGWREVQLRCFVDTVGGGG